MLMLCVLRRKFVIFSAKKEHDFYAHDNTFGLIFTTYDITGNDRH